MYSSRSPYKLAPIIIILTLQIRKPRPAALKQYYVFLNDRARPQIQISVPNHYAQLAGFIFIFLVVVTPIIFNLLKRHACVTNCNQHRVTFSVHNILIKIPFTIPSFHLKILPYSGSRITNLCYRKTSHCIMEN